MQIGGRSRDQGQGWGPEPGLGNTNTQNNQLKKFDQLIEYYIKNIFLENHAQNVVGKLVPDLFIENQKLSYL